MLFVGTVGVWVLGIEVESPHSSVLAPSDSRIGGLLAHCDGCSVVIVDYHAIFCWYHIVYPASTSLGTLTNAKCRPGTMLISHAAICRLCLRRIFLVAFLVHPSGNMNVFLDILPVSSRSCLSFSGASPDVAPESKKAYRHDFLFVNLRAQCAAPSGLL